MPIIYSLGFQRAIVTCGIVFTVTIVYFLLWRSIYYIRTVQPFWSKNKLQNAQKFWFGFISEFASVWHGYELHGVEKLIDTNCLLVGYHARFAVDIAYLIARLQCRFLVNHTTLQVPITSHVLNSLGAVASNADKSVSGEELFVRTLSHGSEPLIVLPGGSYECLKPLCEVEKICWKDAPGFARVIVDNPSLLGVHTRVVPFYTKNCERTAFISSRFYDLTGKICRRATGCPNGSFLFLGITVVFLFSLGFPFLPRPVKLDTYFGDPLTLRTGESAISFAQRVQTELQKLIDEVEKMRESPYPRGRPGLFIRLFLGSVMTAVTGLVFGGGFLLYILLVHPFKMVRNALQKIIF